MANKVKECKWCDGINSGYLYGKDEPLCCLSCGAEWDPVEVEYTDEELEV
jgi:uncharacterized Zn ribbon protein